MTTKSLLLTICYLSCHSWATAQNVDSLFAHVPESVCPILVQSNRLDLLDLYNSRMKAVTPNLYGGQTILAEKKAKTFETATDREHRLVYETI